MRVEMPPKFSCGDRVRIPVDIDTNTIGVIQTSWYDNATRGYQYSVNVNGRNYALFESWLRPAPPVLYNGDVVRLIDGKILTIAYYMHGTDFFITEEGGNKECYHINLIDEVLDVEIDEDDFLQVLEV